MKSWINLVLVKRLIPLVLLLAGWGGYRLVTKLKAESDLAETQKVSAAVADIWIASATYRDHPDQFVAFRDSLLQARGLSIDEIKEYVASREGDIDASYYFASAISGKVDSMYRIIDSTLKARPKPIDTVKATAAKKEKTTPRTQKRMGSVPIYPQEK